MILDDLSNHIQSISDMADIIRLITRSINEDSVYFKMKEQCIFINDMLFHLKTRFHERLKDRNLDIPDFTSISIDNTPESKITRIIKTIISDSTMEDGITLESAPQNIQINSHLFKLLIYNLIDIAVESAYEKTTIYIIWRRNMQAYELSVTSFGPQILNEKETLELFTQGKDIYINHLSGDISMGFYIVRRIAQILHIGLEQTCSFISSYNLPLICEYKHADYDADPHYEKIADSSLDDYDQKWDEIIINQNTNTVITAETTSPQFLKKAILFSTWRTTFRVNIPVQ